MNAKKIIALCLLGLSLFLAGCNLEGLAAFSPTNNRVAIVSNTNKLYTTNFGAGDVKTISGGKQILATFDVSFDPFGQQILYVNEDRNVCVTNAISGGAESCPGGITIPGGAVGGLLSFLPSGEFVLVYPEGATNRMFIYRPNGSLVSGPVSVNQFFLPQSAYKIKRGSNSAEWYLRPYAEDTLRWVITRGDTAYLYESGSTLIQAQPLPGKLNAAVQSVLSERVLTDISSGAVSPDGTKLVFRTKQGESYNLYALDLSAEGKPFQTLVTNANFLIQFRFSPDSTQLAYESNADGRSVWVASADGTNPRKLANNASLPEWNE